MTRIQFGGLPAALWSGSLCSSLPVLLRGCSEPARPPAGAACRCPGVSLRACSGAWTPVLFAPAIGCSGPETPGRGCVTLGRVTPAFLLQAKCSLLCRITFASPCSTALWLLFLFKLMKPLKVAFLKFMTFCFSHWVTYLRIRFAVQYVTHREAGGLFAIATQISVRCTSSHISMCKKCLRGILKFHAKF